MKNALHLILPVVCALVLAALCGPGFVGEARGEVTTLRDGLNGYSGTTDSWVSYTYDLRNYGASPELRLKYWDGLENNALIRFDLAGQLPVHHNVTAATLKIYYYDSSSFAHDNVVTLKPRRLTLGWEEGTGDAGGIDDHGVSWVYRDWNEAQAWPGGAGGWNDSADDGGSWAYIQGPTGEDPYAIKPSSSGATVSFNVTTTVQKWNLGQATNYGFVIVAPDMTGSGHYATGYFRSSDESYYVDYRPTLEITHTLAPVTWTGATDGNWNTSTANWTWDGGGTAFASGDLVNFGESSRTGITVVGTVTPGSVAFNNSAASNYTLSGGAIGGATGLTKSGAGTLTLMSANLYSGTTNISEGVVNIRHSGALGTGGGGTTVSSGAALELQGAGTVTGEALSIAGSGPGGGGALRSVSGTNAWTAQVTLAGSSNTVGVDAASLELSGKVTGAHPLSKVGDGKLILSGGSNDYSGATTVGAGILNVRSASALGSGSANVTVAYGAALELEGTGFTVSGKPLYLAGSGPGGYGALRNVSGANSWTGTTTLTDTTSIQSDAGSLTLAGITGADTGLNLQGSAGGTIGGAIATGIGTLCKIDGGRWTLGGVNTYSGVTLIAEGTLALGSGGSIANTPTIRVEAGAYFDVGAVSGGYTLLPGQTLMGNGTVIGAMRVGGMLSPGTSPGILYTDSLAFDSTGQFREELNGPAPGGKGYDQLVVNGTADLTGAELVASLGYMPETGTKFWIIVGADDLEGTFDGLPQWATFELTAQGPIIPGGDPEGGKPKPYTYTFMISYEGDMSTGQMTGGHDVVLLTPEPATLVLLAAGAGAMLLVGRRRRRATL